MNLSKTSLAVAVVCAGLISACGGGGGGSAASPPAAAPAPPQFASMQTFITDNLATEYSKVWVGITDITVVDDKGAKTSIFASATPAVFNLSSLASVAQMLSSAKIPTGHYVKALVTLDDKVQLVSLDGSKTISAVIKGDGTTTTLPVDVDVDTASANQLVLDFNLAKFTYDGASNKVVPVVVKSTKKGGDNNDFDRNQVDVSGAVVSNDGKELVINSEKHGDNVHIVISSATEIVSEDSGKLLALKDIVVGTRIEARGIIKRTDVVTVETNVIQVRADGTKPGDAPTSVHGEGKVISLVGLQLTVALEDGDFLPGSDKVTIDLSKATFSHGLQTDLKAGVLVSFRGKVTSTGLIATTVEIEGAASADERAQHGNGQSGDGQFSDIHGTVTAVTGTMVELSVRAEESTTVPVGASATTSVKVDLSAATFSKGKLSCVVPGKQLEVAGTTSATVFTARKAELEHGCDAPPAK